MHMMQTYTKGLTSREVNQAGRTITEDIQRTIAMSAPFTVEPAKSGGSSDATDSKYVTRPGGGRLCTGAHTYAWNYGHTSELGGDSTVNIYNQYDDNDGTIRLVKVSDAGAALCLDTTLPIPKNQSKELLESGDRNLAVHSLEVRSDARDNASGQALYSIDLTIGTNDHTQLDAGNTACLPPKEGSGNEDFCAINQFNIIARAGNRSGSL